MSLVRNILWIKIFVTVCDIIAPVMTFIQPLFTADTTRYR